MCKFAHDRKTFFKMGKDMYSETFFHEIILRSVNCYTCTTVSMNVIKSGIKVGANVYGMI